MGVQTIIGQKIDQSQKFLEDGTRIPVTTLWVKENVVVSHKTIDKDNYSAIQLGFGQKKKASKAQMGQIKGASLKAAPKILKEVKMEGDLPQIGQVINATEVFKPGDMINVTGVSKGKGYAGVVKRHHFKGGPRTHGQSDRERAPGSIGQTTTPGRVYKGKRMAGRMGHETATIRNLEVMDVSEDLILVKGLVPGGKNSLIIVKKVGENKKFVPLYRKKEEVEKEMGSGQPQISDDARQKEEKSTEDSSSLSEIQPTEIAQESMGKSEANFSSSETGLSTSQNSETENKEASESRSAPVVEESNKKEKAKNAK